MPERHVGGPEFEARLGSYFAKLWRKNVAEKAQLQEPKGKGLTLELSVNEFNNIQFLVSDVNGEKRPVVKKKTKE